MDASHLLAIRCAELVPKDTNTGFEGVNWAVRWGLALDGIKCQSAGLINHLKTEAPK